MPIEQVLSSLKLRAENFKTALKAKKYITLNLDKVIRFVKRGT